MTQVTKNIRGQTYLYFQDSVKIGRKYKIVTTMIGRADLEGQELLKVKEEAVLKHIIKILKEKSLIKNIPFHFENIRPSETPLLEGSLEYVKLLYDAYKKSLTGEERDEFENALFTKYVHGTTAIEGNTLTEDETYRLLAADLTPANKTVNETLEIANYNVVRTYVNAYNGPVTEKMIRRAHALLMNGVKGSNGKLIESGFYRTGQAILAGIGFKPVSAEIIADNLKYLLQEYYNKIEQGVHPIELASYFHQKFEEIHPFQDGNGRVGREILNYMLEQNGFPPIYILPKHRSEYLTALQEGNVGNYDPLFAFIASRMAGTLAYMQTKSSIYSKMITPESRKMFTEMGAEDIYDRVMVLITRYKEENELP